MDLEKQMVPLARRLICVRSVMIITLNTLSQNLAYKMLRLWELLLITWPAIGSQHSN